ncbi:hypothetical protein [Vibrio sp. WXL103]|uniref:hypothetical protein n=1 Tax=Vibrio sp. WXL103 TaxID=3450710 RepID=UPI003EC4DC8B
MTLRSERSQPALAKDYFVPNELSFEQLILWAKKLASQLPYQDETGQIQGHWDQLFEQNELVVCAAILCVDEAAWTQQFKQIQPLGEVQAVKFILQFFQQLEEWYHGLPNEPECSGQLKLRLINIYQTQLRQAFQSLYQLSPTEQRNLFAPFDTMWQLEHRASIVPSGTLHEQTQHCLSKIMIAIASLKQECRKTLQLSLRHGEHPAQIGLYISFLRLFKRAQEKINQFSHQHLLFYYRDVLKQNRQQAQQAPVFVKLSQAQPTREPVVVDQDHKFSPGNASDFTPIFYRAAYGIAVTDAEVEQVFSFSLSRDPLISPETELGLTSSANGNRHHLIAHLSGPKARKQPAIGLFDAISDQTHNKSNEAQAMGLIISDPILSLSEGERALKLEFELRELGVDFMYPQLAKLNDYRNTANSHDHPLDIEHLKRSLEPIIEHMVAIQTTILGHWLTDVSQPQIIDQFDSTMLKSLPSQQPEQMLGTVYRLFFMGLFDLTCQQLRSMPSSQENQRRLFRILGQLTIRHALYAKPWLSQSDITAILGTIQPFKDKNAGLQTVLATLEPLLGHSSTQTFYLLFDQAFDIHMTTPKGWHKVEHAQLVPLDSDQKNSPLLGFALNAHLDPGFAEVGVIQSSDAASHSSLPAIKLSLKKQNKCFVYSIFKDFEFSELNIQCKVDGLARLQYFNQDGQADSSQPFFPLGAQPRLNSYLIIANQEIASKPVTSLSFHLDWIGLPQDYDGFRGHYEAYPHNLTNDSFRVSTHVLNRGKWDRIGTRDYPLFTSNKAALEQESEIAINRMQHSFTPNTEPWPTTPYSPKSSVRNGLIKLTLTSPSSAFGHDQFPTLLSQTLTHNVKSKSPQPLPKAPYTPSVIKLIANYRAQKRVQVSSIEPEEPCKITHIHPFGESIIYPLDNSKMRVCQRLLPRYDQDGHVFIGLRASQLAGYLNLYFMLDEESDLLSPYPSSSFEWFYLVDNQWVPLPAANMIHDTTQGFLTSGIITLEIPAAINTHHSIMPTDLYWLRVSTSEGLGRFPKCYQVATHVLQINPDADTRDFKAPFSNWHSRPKLSQLSTIAQLTAMEHCQETESEQEWITRTSEYLRHKGKATNPWDYERIVLTTFPSVGSVNCFASHRFECKTKQPGHVLIIVTPNSLSCQHAPCQRKNLNVATLVAIKNHLQHATRPQARLEVRNPGYEEIQVRCQVCFAKGIHHGLALRRLKYAITKALCPWQANSLNQGLGWTLSLAKLTAFIKQQAHVVAVSGLSVVKISQLSAHDYQLSDSARNSSTIAAKYPWYMLISASDHLISVTPEVESSQPCPAGLGNLAIGEQFIIQATSEQTQNSLTANKKRSR